MRRRQINQLRAKGLIPPVEAHLREAWERERAPKPEPEVEPVKSRRGRPRKAK